ncbi:hypothetical protein D3C72_1129070 [compost metagenome]
MTNIVQLWGDRISPQYEANALQLDLFGGEVSLSNFVTFLDIDDLDQDIFLSILTKNPVSAVLDIRPRPVFRRPKFVHSEISQHMAVQHIHYFDYAVALGDADDGSIRSIARRINYRRDHGLTLCLYDDSSRERGWIEAARRTLRRSRLFKAELSPTALVS